MSRIVSGVTRQTTVSDVYKPQECGPLDQAQCPITSGGFQDWRTDFQNCGVSIRQPICSRTNSLICPLFSNTQHPAPIWETNGSWTNTLQMGRNVVCRYELSSIRTTEDVQEWLNTFGPTGDYNQVIMPEFCSKPEEDISTCAQYTPTSGTNSCTGGLTGCSRLTSSSAAGKLCRDWASKNRSLAFNAAGVFCAANTCAQDCKCYNRDKVDSIYIQLSEAGAALPTKDACWYKPCQISSSFLIPEDQNISGPSVCPTEICQQVINVLNNQGSSINIDVARQDISCTYSPPTPSTPPPIPTGDPSHVNSIWSKYGWVFIVIIVIVFLIVIVIIIITSLHKKTPRTAADDTTTIESVAVHV